ncbi:MAG: hypothetical protein OXR62_06390 [Ahrensia sp.]|nr:hypothetical protein [Ahrensia sp.]
MNQKGEGLSYKERVDRLPESLRPRYRLFFSVDLVGSTRLKQLKIYPLSDVTEDEAGERSGEYFSKAFPNFDWFSQTDAFFREFWLVFRTFYRDLNESDIPSGSIELWKTAGDEVIFSVSISSRNSVPILLMAFAQSIRMYEQLMSGEKPTDDRSFSEHRSFDALQSTLSTFGRSQAVSLTGTVWSAGLPFTNRELLLVKDDEFRSAKHPQIDRLVQSFDDLNEYYSRDEDDNKSGAIEYIGPTVDIGFRICQFSKPKRLIMSLEVTYMLTMDANNREKLDHKNISVNFFGRHELKGVLGGARYPIFGLDISEDKDFVRLENRFSGHEGLSYRDVAKYCELYFGKYGAYIQEPTMITKGVLPENMLERLELLHEIIKAEKERYNSKLNLRT